MSSETRGSRWMRDLIAQVMFKVMGMKNVPLGRRSWRFPNPLSSNPRDILEGKDWGTDNWQGEVLHICKAILQQRDVLRIGFDILEQWTDHKYWQQVQRDSKKQDLSSQLDEKRKLVKIKSKLIFIAIILLITLFDLFIQFSFFLFRSNSCYYSSFFKQGTSNSAMSYKQTPEKEKEKKKT